MKTTLLISALAVSLNACAIDADSATPETDDETVEGSIRRLSANALMPSDLEPIPVGALTQAYVNALAEDKENRGALGYLVSCALPTGASITAQYNCTVFGCTSTTYQGSIGLMSNWKTAVPTLDQQRKLSACVLSRLNEFGRSLTISLRGAGYSMDPNEASTHVYKEGAFFGNVFAGADNYWGSCDADGPTHPWRQCAQEGHCGIDWAGDCASACTADANGNMTSCTGANGVTYTQPTTAWLSSVN